MTSQCHPLCVISRVTDIPCNCQDLDLDVAINVICQNMSNVAGLVWKADFGHFLGNILGLSACLLKLICALNP